MSSLRAPHLDDGDVVVYHGDCIEVMREMAEASVDAIVTDPPYGLEFMGRDWDGFGTPLGFQSWTEAWAREAFRVLKPGGHLLAFAGTRTYHRMAAGVEDAGFEIRDCIAWMYGSGFPKSKNLDGAWSGWGTALKPAYEPIVVARKPLIGTVAQNVLKHGTGALNIDATRIAGDMSGGVWKGTTKKVGYEGGWDSETKPNLEPHAAGRWPANVALDETAAAMLDEQSGERGGGFGVRGAGTSPNAYGGGKGYAGTLTETGQDVGYGDTGGASRFFYTAKASRQDRNAGGLADNTHPTVKPTELMRWLIRLATPPGGIILDPFGGSGSTGVAARAENVRCILIEREPEYLHIIRDRLAQQSLFAEETLRDE
jgi:DNA modification methylase